MALAAELDDQLEILVPLSEPLKHRHGPELSAPAGGSAYFWMGTCTRCAQSARVQKTLEILGTGGRPMKILCPRCHYGRVDDERHDRCERCRYRPSRAQKEQVRTGRLVRNGLIGLVSVLAVVWLVSVL